MTGEEKAANVGHELFSHALFIILGKDSGHGGKDGQGNPELEKQINEREQEAIENYNK